MHKNMHYKKIIIDIFAVTFREEGVDWNVNGAVNQQGKLSHLPRGRCGLKFYQAHLSSPPNPSPSARKVWIEIIRTSFNYGCISVTFREEGVDWNYFRSILSHSCSQSPSARKVWIEILQKCTPQGGSLWSPSARKVWIEIDSDYELLVKNGSPSARKVWIEIRNYHWSTSICVVTFREEGVDWNSSKICTCNSSCCHLPRGRCGLKYQPLWYLQDLNCHLPRGRCGLQ